MVCTCWTFYDFADFVSIQFLFYLSCVLCCPEWGFYVFLFFVCELVDTHWFWLIGVYRLFYFWFLWLSTKFLTVHQCLKVIVLLELYCFLDFLQIFFMVLLILFSFNAGLSFLFQTCDFLLLLYEILNCTLPTKYVTLSTAYWLNKRMVTNSTHFEFFYWILAYSWFYCTILTFELLFLLIGEYWLRCIVFRVSTHTILL